MTALDLARRHSAESLRLVEADRFLLHFRTESFGCCIMSEVLEHVGDPVGLLSEVRRVMGPSGRLLVSVPSSRYPLLWDPVNRSLEGLTGMHLKEGLWSGIWAGHLRLYSRESLQPDLTGAGFDVITVRGVTGLCLPFNNNLVYVGARLMYAGSLPEAICSGFDRFEGNQATPHSALRAFLALSRWLESANRRWPRKNAEVGFSAGATLAWNDRLLHSPLPRGPW